MNKINKFTKALGLTALSMGLLVGCSDTTGVETGGSNNVAKETAAAKETAPKDDGSKKFNAAVAAEVMGLKINIADVKITDTEIQVGMNLENTTDGLLTFYPDQGSVVVGDMQLDANMFLGSGEVSGDINGGVKMDGVIVFSVPEGKTLDVAAVKELKFNFGDVFNENFETAPYVVAVPVK